MEKNKPEVLIEDNNQFVAQMIQDMVNKPKETPEKDKK